MTATTLGASLRRLAQGSLTLITSNVAGAVLGFALSLTIGRGVGEAGFGRWTFCMAWASALTMIAEFGLNTLLTREAACSPYQANQLLVGSLAAKLVFSGALGGGLLVTAPVLGIDVETAAALRVALVLVVAGTAFGSFTALFRACQWMEPILWLNVGGLVLQLLGAAWIVRWGAGSPVLRLVILASGVQVTQLLLAGGLWWARLRPWGGRLRPSSWLIGRMVRQAVPFAAAGALGALQMRSSPLLLGYLRGEVEVGWFGAASRFSEAAKLIPNGIFGAAFPALAAGARGHGHAAVFRAFDRTLLGLAVAVAAGLAVFAPWILGQTYGPAFLPAAPVLIWLGIGLLPTLVNGGVELYLYAVGDEAYAVRLGLLSVAVQIAASLPLISAFGAGGAAMGVVLGEAVIWFPLRARARKWLEVKQVER